MLELSKVVSLLCYAPCIFKAVIHLDFDNHFCSPAGLKHDRLDCNINKLDLESKSLAKLCPETPVEHLKPPTMGVRKPKV